MHFGITDDTSESLEQTASIHHIRKSKKNISSSEFEINKFSSILSFVLFQIAMNFIDATFSIHDFVQVKLK